MNNRTCFRSRPSIGWSFRIRKSNLRALGPEALAFRMVRSNSRWGIAPTTDRGFLVLLRGVDQRTLDQAITNDAEFEVRIVDLDTNIGFAEIAQ